MNNILSNLILIGTDITLMLGKSENDIMNKVIITLELNVNAFCFKFSVVGGGG